jgi:hypothetical protein
MRRLPHLRPHVCQWTPSLGRLKRAEEPVLGGKQRRGRPAGYPQLRVDVLHVVGRRFRLHHQALSDVFGGLASGQQPEHLNLTRGESGGMLGPRWSAVAGGPEHVAHRRHPADRS